VAQHADRDEYLLELKVSDAYLFHFEQPGPTKIGVRFHLFPLPSGVMLAVPTIQIGGIQTRVAVPLFDKKSMAWARWCLGSKKVTWLLDCGEKHKVVSLSISQNFLEAHELLELIGESYQDISAYRIALDRHLAQHRSPLHTLRESRAHLCKQVIVGSLDSMRSSCLPWPKAESTKSRKRKRSVKQIHLDLGASGYEGSYDRIAAFARQWKRGLIREGQCCEKIKMLSICLCDF
jgi:hypothetical protein